MEANHIMPKLGRNQPDITSWIRPNGGALKHIFEDVKYFIQSHMKTILGKGQLFYLIAYNTW